VRCTGVEEGLHAQSRPAQYIYVRERVRRDEGHETRLGSDMKGDYEIRCYIKQTLFERRKEARKASFARPF
jgi:hypothetical protein